jgi:hypothetical protein
MSGSQIFVAGFGTASVALSIFAIWMVVKSPAMRHKPLWIIGSLIGVVGFSINWSAPGDLFMLFGFQIPPVMVMALGSDHVIVKTAFPIVAIVAIAKSRIRRIKPEAGQAP